ncbi:hypothetical protein SAMN04488038_1084 [Solimonas aquatica]|uniref:Short-chain dehydrogenase n=1 Tax=Solimonas aquatica TaxID=489703 RepID=A0A1H9H3E9_9GAMM|nr:SDR family oxidoreductase [Solimonas aquatica]SEQ56777.1 hypothetical protein SAMN04488038_1084 [Solimonas aquatica]
MNELRVLIIGATSAIAQACARIWAARGAQLLLAARDAPRGEAIAADLRLRGAAAVHCLRYDAGLPPQSLLDALSGIGMPDIVLIAHGSLPDQARCEHALEALHEAYRINALSVLELATLLGEALRAQGHGTLAVIGSVAGDRGRASNYVYGSAKAAVAAFLSGLRQRLHGSGVNVLTIKPGFVDTPMTRDFAKNALWAQPETIAAGIVRAIEQGRAVVYLPGWWRWLMLLIRLIPEPLFRRLRL